MKAIKNIKWRVHITQPAPGMFTISAFTENESQVSSIYFQYWSGGEKAKKAWERFAKLNGITKYKFV